MAVLKHYNVETNQWERLVAGIPGAAGATGATGVQGAQGATGIAGPQGELGATGVTGATGVSLYESSAVAPTNTDVLWLDVAQTGVFSFVGATGPQGEVGVTGPTGATGPQGLQGVQGEQGLVGEIGPQGVTGVTGVTGPAPRLEMGGFQVIGTVAEATIFPVAPGAYVLDLRIPDVAGATGPQGLAGVTGPTGATGPQGAVGITGATGPQGVAGVTGTAGPQGSVGETGATGPQGVTGPLGATGLQGIQGVPGEVGAPFAITKIYASLTALLADTAPTGIVAGQFAIINTNDVNDPDNSKLYLWTGTEYSYVTDLSGAEGVQGPQGVQGVQGLQGPQGVTGVTGATGPQGVTGTAGPQGSVGVTGATGLRGVTGVTGATGVQGVTGGTGATGAQGVTGATGPQGATGAKGSQGSVGATGAIGPQGVTGTTGDKGGVRYTFSSTTTDADPGNGTLRYNNATIASVTQLFIDNVDAVGVAQTLWYSAWDDSTTTSTRGFIQVTGNVAGSTVVNIFRITGAVTAATGYYKIPVSYVSGSIPANATAVVVDFSRTGDIGVTGATGPQGAVGATGPQGTVGVTGATGAVGPQGATGVANYNNPQFTGTASFGGPIQEGYVNGGNTGTAKTIALTSGTLQNFTLTGNCTFTMPTAVAGQSFTVLLRTGTTGGFTATFTGVKWPDNTAPTVTTTANRLDLFVFVSDGTIWYGSVLQGYAP